ncbi:MAG: T9SS type A sorting domain-containing protein [Bacteroidota bacterium]
MKTFILLSLSSLLSFVAHAQEFEFKLLFNDSLGNKDSLNYGYDLAATNSIDAAFGEIDILSVPHSSSFNVRFSDVLVNGKLSPNYQSKKQIIANKCPNWLLNDFGVSIEIDSKNYPITLKWDKSLFKDSCRIGTILTDVHPGGWFDTRGHFRTFLAEDDSVVIKEPYYFYTNAASKKISVLWIAFMDSSVFKIPFDPMIFEPDPLGINTLNQSASLEVFPNPLKEDLHIRTNAKINEVELYDLQGRKIIMQKGSNVNNLHLEVLPTGTYLLKVRDDNGNVFIKRVVKAAFD